MAGKPLLLVSLLGALPFASPACAAEQGTMGATSKSEIVVTVSVAAHVALSEVRTMAVSTGDGQTACLWLATATRGYAVTALGAPIIWKASATATSGRTIAPETTLGNLSSTTALPDCNRNPSLFVGYRAAIATTRPATLLIAPE